MHGEPHIFSADPLRKGSLMSACGPERQATANRTQEWGSKTGPDFCSAAHSLGWRRRWRAPGVAKGSQVRVPSSVRRRRRLNGVRVKRTHSGAEHRTQPVHACMHLARHRCRRMGPARLGRSLCIAAGPVQLSRSWTRFCRSRLDLRRRWDPFCSSAWKGPSRSRWRCCGAGLCWWWHHRGTGHRWLRQHCGPSLGRCCMPTQDPTIVSV